MDNFDTRTTLKQLSAVIAVLGVLAVIIGLFIVEKRLQWVLGMGLGTVISVLRAVLLYRALVKSTDMEQERASLYIKAQYTLRMVIAVVVTVLGFVLQRFINPWGILIGLVLMQPAVYITGFVFAKKDGEANG